MKVMTWKSKDIKLGDTIVAEHRLSGKVFEYLLVKDRQLNKYRLVNLTSNSLMYSFSSSYSEDVFSYLHFCCGCRILDIISE
ncbi:hypothetical protein RVS70_05790 [Virgibacillus sp. M23]|uniref:hypothetical protein n=1 Tax=Virgibacillus sp. M23 TaxID=3079030 RepID=UPI002A90CC2D|nr:hypothetical protein [Virgibacillus sp. M23]MDY7043713.1 hypothetical protein [Virgibacillus sp. M23]